MTEDLLSEPDRLVEYRLKRLEETQRDLLVRSEGWHNTLGAQITGLSNQIGTTMASLPTMYTPRPEAEERHRAIDARFEALIIQMQDRRQTIDQRIESNTRRVERIEQAGWGFAIGLVGTLLAALFALFKSTVGG